MSNVRLYYLEIVAMHFLKELYALFRATGPVIKRGTAQTHESDEEAEISRFLFLFDPERITELSAKDDKRDGPKWSLTSEKVDFVH